MSSRYFVPFDYPAQVRDTIRNIRISKLPRSKLTKVAAIYREGKHGYGGVLVMTQNGTIYASSINTASVVCDSLSLADDMESLYKLGAFEYWVYRDWLDYTKVLKARKRQYDAALDLSSVLKQLGLAPTKAQKRLIDKATAGTP